MYRLISVVSLVTWIGILFVASAPSAALVTGGDDFNDGIVDGALWGVPIVTGSGVITETNGRLEYSAPSNPTSYDEVYYYWVGNSPTFGSNWGIWLDIHIDTEHYGVDQVTSFGLYVINGNDPTDYAYSEMYSSSLGGPPLRRGFFTEMLVNGVLEPWQDSGGLCVDGTPLCTAPEQTPITGGALQFIYNAETNRITSYYSLTGGGEDWIQFSNFGIAGGSGEASYDWEMQDSDSFEVAIYGWSSNVTVVGGEMWGDNFTMTNAPEPASAALVSFGLIAITLSRRRSRS